MEIVHVRCIKCQQDKPETEFNLGTGKNRNGKRSTCRSCTTAYMKAYYAEHGERMREQARDNYQNNRDRRLETTREWVKKNPRRVKDNLLKWSFGISLEQYEQLLESQNGVCGICKKPPKRIHLAVDHDHDTGAIRGLLCTHCNTVIGFAKDDPSILESAIDYLKHHITPTGD